MSSWAFGLLVVLTVSPAIVVLRLPPHLGWRSLWPGLVTAAVIGTGVVVVAEPLTRWADVEPESFRLAAGLVLIVTGLARLGFPVGRREERVGGPVGWLVPVAYPVVLGPELLLALFAAGVDDDRWAGVGGLLIGLALAGWAVTRRARSTHPGRADVGWRAAARLTAGGQVLVATALTIDAIRAV